jgi:hypothetical protein
MILESAARLSASMPTFPFAAGSSNLSTSMEVHKVLEEPQGIESMGLTISIRCARSTSMHLSHDSGACLIIPRLDRDSGTGDNLGAVL